MKRFSFHCRMLLWWVLPTLVPLLLLATAWHCRVWSWHDWQVYQMMSRECHPVWRELHWGRIRAGQTVDEVLLVARPVCVRRYGAFEVFEYQDALSFTGVTILAKDGRVAEAAAWSCTWNREFFNQLTDADRKAFAAARETRISELAREGEAPAESQRAD